MWPRDTLVEVARSSPGLPPTWLCVPKGAEGKVLGYRDRNEESFAIVDVDGFDKRTVVYVRETKLATGPATDARESGHFGARYFHAAFIAYDALIAHAFIASAMAFPVFGGPKDLFAKEAFFFRFQCTVVDGFGFLYLSPGPFPNLIRRSQPNL
jgi:hypothetical protein